MQAKLHQTWKSKDNLPWNFQFWSDSFVNLNSSLVKHIYDDEENRHLVKGVCANLLGIYDALPREIFRVDFVRPIYLFEFGGIYADMDFQCLQPLPENVINPDGIVLGRMGTDETFGHSLPNAFMASKAQMGFWLGYLAHIEEIASNTNADSLLKFGPERVTGPIVLKFTADLYLSNRGDFIRKVEQFCRKYNLSSLSNRMKFEDLHIFPGHTFYPIDWNDKIHHIWRERFLADETLLTVEEARNLFPTSLAVTYWAHSWGYKTKKKKFWKPW